MPKIHCLNNISSYGTDQLPADYELTDQINEATGILVRSAAMHDMEFGPQLLAIARAGAGVNNIPLERCAEEGIVVFNTPGANANAVKELVIASMVMASRNLIASVNWCIDNADDPDIAKSVESAKKAFAGSEIMGKKLGVIGLGAIGARVARAAIDLGMQVYGCDPYVSVDAAWNIDTRVNHISKMEDIYKSCDFITVHVPALDSTKGMLGKDAFAIMKPGAVVLNFSRDTLVDEEAMAAALEDGTVSHYITDFATPAVMKMKNVTVTPHLGASTEEAEDNCAFMAVKELVDYIENGNISNSVNYPAVTLGSAEADGGRLAVLHKNVPNMVGQITNILGENGANIANMVNASRGDYAYTLIALDKPAEKSFVEAICAIGDVIRVRLVK
ncbi:MAG: phosphoglycerate dehydrogenase [Eggerthellaceae bacterium]|nr:phosphoglycerate dehydrogenase [Eggerthellaceae bacterium]